MVIEELEPECLEAGTQDVLAHFPCHDVGTLSNAGDA